MIIKLIIWILIVYAITQIIAESEIFSPVRNMTYITSHVEIYDPQTARMEKILDKVPTVLTHFITCYMCQGFWWGMLISVLLWSPTMEIFQMNILSDAVRSWVLFVFFDGCLGSVISWFIHLIEKKYL